MAEKEPEFKPKRLNIRRWTRPCKDCGEIVVFVENGSPPVAGKPWRRWILVEMFGVRDGEPCFWEGSVVFNPKIHVEHTDCPRVKRRKAWLIRRANYDL